jgi:hypothetical protein
MPCVMGGPERGPSTITAWWRKDLPIRRLLRSAGADHRRRRGGRGNFVLMNSCIAGFGIKEWMVWLWVEDMLVGKI